VGVVSEGPNNKLVEGWAQPIDDAHTFHYFAGLLGLGGLHFRSLCRRHLIAVESRLYVEPPTDWRDLYKAALRGPPSEPVMRDKVRLCRDCAAMVLHANQTSLPSER